MDDSRLAPSPAIAYCGRAIWNTLFQMTMKRFWLTMFLKLSTPAPSMSAAVAIMPLHCKSMKTTSFMRSHVSRCKSVELGAVPCIPTHPRHKKSVRTIFLPILSPSPTSCFIPSMEPRLNWPVANVQLVFVGMIGVVAVPNVWSRNFFSLVIPLLNLPYSPTFRLSYPGRNNRLLLLGRLLRYRLRLYIVRSRGLVTPLCISFVFALVFQPDPVRHAFSVSSLFVSSVVVTSASFVSWSLVIPCVY